MTDLCPPAAGHPKSGEANSVAGKVTMDLRPPAIGRPASLGGPARGIAKMPLTLTAGRDGAPA
ncbi:MAG: hypothetical protein ACT4OM_09860 [Actinomycetota bacterium]